MRTAIGLKAHSGWAALVALGADGARPLVIERRRVELVEEADAHWAKAPYHAAEKLRPDQARDLVRRGIESAHRIAIREMTAVRDRLRDAGHELVACSVLAGEPMPDWSVDQILAVHFRMHKAEGVLFQDALIQAANACGVNHVPIREKSLVDRAQQEIDTIAALGKTIGPPWAKDQKDAALAAMIGLGRKS